MKTERQISAGGVVFRKTNGQVYAALISVKNGKVWTLPKGIVEKGENIARTAHREVLEETGLNSRIIKKIGHIHYFYCHKEDNELKRFFKLVYFFLMEWTDGDVKDHDAEVTDCQWFLIDDAIQLVRYEDEKEILKKARGLLAPLTEKNL